MKQTFKFLTVFLLALLGASNLWATDYYIYVCPADVWGSSYDGKGVNIGYTPNNGGSWKEEAMTLTGFKDGGKVIYGYKMTTNPNTGLSELKFVNHGDYYGAGDWGNSADHVYHGYNNGHKWTDIPATSNASGVWLAGTFNSWTNEDPNFALTKQDGNHWTGAFLLDGKSGNYEFKVYAKDSPMNYGYQFSGNGFWFNSSNTQVNQLWSNNGNDQIVPPASSGKFRIEVEYFGNYDNHGQLKVVSKVVKTLSFAKGNSSATGTVPSSQYLANGDKITLPANPFTLTGYSFAGWNDGSNTYSAGAEYTMGSSDKTLTAQWTPNTYTVTLDNKGADDGKGGSASVTATYGADMPSATMPTKTGYNFQGYYDADGSTSGDWGIQYYTSAGASAHVWDKDDDATLYAQWTEKMWSVSASYGAGGASATVTTSPAGQVTGTAISAEAADGYIFSGWTITEGDGSFADAKSASTTYYPTSASKLEATFARATVTVNSGISSNHATLSGASATHPIITIGTDTEVPGDEDVTFTVSNLDNGYQIEGWYTNSDYTEDKHDAGQSTYVLSSTNPNKNVYVKITPITYTITYNENGGTEQTDGTYTIESAEITLPTSNEITRTNYTFLGWYLNSGFTGEVQKQIAAGSTGNKEYWAKWEETKHTVTLVNAETGNSVQVGNVTPVTIVANTPTPGYYFTGWTETGNVTITDATSATTTIKATGTGSVTANFAERFYLRGSIQGKTDIETGGMPGWGDDAKDSGKGLFTTIDGNTATITKNLEAATEYKLKLGDLQGDCSWGGSNEFTNDADLWTFACNAKDDCAAPTFRTSIAGDYTFTIDFSAASPKMKITYPAVPDFTLTVAEARVYEETPMANFIAGNGTVESPYQFYLDEKMTLTVTALSPVTGVTAYYKFGDDAESSTVLTKDITAANTTVQSIVVKTYYRGSIGSYTSAEKTETIYYQGVAVPALHLHSSLTKDEVEKGSAPENVTIYYTTENYEGAATITKNDVAWGTVESGSQWHKEETLDNTIHSDTYVATATPNERTFTTSLVVSVYRYVQVKVKDANPKWASHLYMWNSVSGKKNAEWPGEALSTQLGDWYIFAVKYPTYDKFVVNDGKTTGKQTIDLDIPAEDICYEIGAFKEKRESKDIYNCETGTCPNGLYVGDIANVEMYNGESATASPVVQLDPTLNENDLQIAFSFGTNGVVTASQSGKKIMLSAIKAGSTTVTATYSIAGATSVAKTFTVTVTGAVMIQVKVPYNYDWNDKDHIYIHYWGIGLPSGANQYVTYKGADGSYDRYYARIPLCSDNKVNFQVVYYDYSHTYNHTKEVNNVEKSGCYTIGLDDGTYGRDITRDDDNCWADYQVKIVMNNGTVYTSNTIGDISETLSFFAPGEDATGYNRGDVYLMCNGSQKAVIPSSTFATSGVYTAKTDGSTLTDVALYTGDYYIRTDGADGGWNEYKTNADNKFVKFDAIETSTYDHYWVKNIKQNSLNLQACVGNDYNENLANKIEASNYTDGVGNVTPDDKGVNLRFGYSPLTNNFERAIIKGSSTDEFLNVIGANVYKEKACSTALNTQNADSKFEDKEQWIYEKTVYVKIDGTHISADAKLQSKAYNNQVMYQLGYEIDPITGHETATPKTFGLIAAGTTNGTYAIKLVYDFKTNRMVSGWTPDGDISGNVVLDADMLLVRKHQEAAQQIRFSNNGASISKIKHLYGVMEIEKEKMIAAETATMYALHLYWISFPFDVKVSSIFGVGTYGKEWKLQRYDGAERASKGWFKGDGTTTFWKDMTLDETMNANEGYILNLKPSAFDKEECEIWNHGRTVAAFYFPSVLDNVGLIKADSHEQSIPEHECKIDRTFNVQGVGEVNHMNTDSHWNVMGIPAFQDAVPSTSEDGFHAVYKWVPSTNTYDVQEVNNEFQLQTMYAYMVQYHGIINWTNVSVISKAPYAYADDKNYTIELFFNGNGAEDHTYIKLADEAATDFVLNEDMMKIDNAGYPNIYSFAGNYNVAYNETKMIDQVVTIGVSAPKDGSYTFSMPKDFSGSAILVDLEEGTFTDLNVSNYSVDLNKGTYNNRFQLMLEVEAKIPTNIENANGGLWSEDGKTQKLLINDNIYLINAGRIYNATGVQLR